MRRDVLRQLVQRRLGAASAAAARLSASCCEGILWAGVPSAELGRRMPTRPRFSTTFVKTILFVETALFCQPAGQSLRIMGAARAQLSEFDLPNTVSFLVLVVTVGRETPTVTFSPSSAVPQMGTSRRRLQPGIAGGPCGSKNNWATSPPPLK